MHTHIELRPEYQPSKLMNKYLNIKPYFEINKKI